MGGAPPLPLVFAPQGAKNGHFWPFFWAPRIPGRRPKNAEKAGFGLRRAYAWGSGRSPGTPHGGGFRGAHPPPERAIRIGRGDCRDHCPAAAVIPPTGGRTCADPSGVSDANRHVPPDTTELIMPPGISELAYARYRDSIPVNVASPESHQTRGAIPVSVCANLISDDLIGRHR